MQLYNRTYTMFSTAVALGLFMSVLYLLEFIPAYIALVAGFVGGLIVFQIFK